MPRARSSLIFLAFLDPYNGEFLTILTGCYLIGLKAFLVSELRRLSSK